MIRTFLTVCFFLLLAARASWAANEYEGTLNGVNITALVSFDESDKSVSGKFKRIGDDSKVFTFEGSNAVAGKIRITVSDNNGNVIGSATMTKVLTTASIIWSGKLNFNDGNSFPFEFSRRRGQ